MLWEYESRQQSVATHSVANIIDTGTKNSQDKVLFTVNIWKGVDIKIELQSNKKWKGLELGTE